MNILEFIVGAVLAAVLITVAFMAAMLFGGHYQSETFMTSVGIIAVVACSILLATRK